MEANNKLYLCSDAATAADPFYRYIVTLPHVSHLTIKGTPITVFDNSNEVARGLQMEQTLMMRLIAARLGCRTKDNQFVGTYMVSQVVQILCHDIIRPYLLCHKCDKPEVTLGASKSVENGIRKKCRACGEKTYLCMNAASKLNDIWLKSL